ncbi:MAG TPA: SLATT domain-containing protein [Anaerolineales bacterium]|nr:SLATT domain-containing protein [Anaerolineales bacterium]
METETPKAAPILNIAWTRYAQLNAVSSRRSRAHKRLRIWIAAMGILATLFAILTQAYFTDQTSIEGVVVKVLFVSAPIIASILAAWGSRAFSNGDWLITRAAAEEYLKEIYFYRTILQKKASRRSYLEKRINEIQKRLFRGLGGELAFRPYVGPVPPYYNPDSPDSDPGFQDLTGDEYFRYRLEDQLRWHIKEVNEYKRERGLLTFWIAVAGGLGAIFAAIGAPISILVALTASITAALIGWQELRSLDSVIKNYSKVILELTSLYDHWLNLEPEERTTAEFYKLVRGCEDVLWAQNTEYIKSMQEALKDASLEEEASLVNRVVKESVESAERMKQAMREDLVEFTEQSLQEAEQKVEETFKAVLGTLAEEASSEIVQQELEAMGKAVVETAQNVMERASAFSSSLAQIAEEFAHVDVGRDTSKEQLNAILARYPRTNDVKG